MNAQEFCYWLQGRAELLPEQPPSAEEWAMIREHLGLVFKKVTSPLDAYKTPPYGFPAPQYAPNWPQCSPSPPPLSDRTVITC